MHAAATTLDDFHRDAPPRWQEPVVTVSVAAIAAAVGFGVLQEAGAAPWLSITSALLTAAVLFGVHRGLRPRPAGVADEGLGIGRDITPMPPPMPAPAGRSMSPPPSAVATPPPIPAMAQANVQNRPQPQAPDLAHFVPRQPTAMPVLPLPARKTPPPNQATASEVKFEDLEVMIRQMAAAVPGPKAISPDPDLASRSHVGGQTLAAQTSGSMADTPPTLQVGFGAPAMAQTGQRIAEAVAAERIDVLLTPIQSLVEHRASHFEVSVQLRDEDGEVLAADEVVRVVRHTGLSGRLDALKLSRVARVARRVQARGGAPADVLADMFGPSLADTAFIAASGRLLAGTSPAPIVLAIAQTDVRAFGRVHWSALATLGDLGLRFAISDVIDLDMDFELMAARGFVFAKLDAGVFLDGLPLGTIVIPATDVVRHLDGSGLAVIVGRIDDEARLDQVAACGVSLGQGALFGDPKPVRQDILTDPPPGS